MVVLVAYVAYVAFGPMRELFAEPLSWWSARPWRGNMTTKHLLITSLAALSLIACGSDEEEEGPPPVELSTTLSGAAEKPTAVQTPGSGQASLTITLVTGAAPTLAFSGSFKDLTANATAAHIHGPADENSTGPVFCNLQVPPAVSGSISAGQGAGACATVSLTDADLENFKAGKMYVNLHTPTNPNGEIRGQLKQ
ncbi:MAG TPA: CHRD domain-containing protein [Myxococcaceae bacterium]